MQLNIYSKIMHRLLWGNGWKNGPWVGSVSPRVMGLVAWQIGFYKQLTE